MIPMVTVPAEVDLVRAALAQAAGVAPPPLGLTFRQSRWLPRIR